MARIESQDEKRAALGEVADYFGQNGHEMEPGEAEQVLSDPPSTPSFPIFIASMAVLKDILDIPGDFGIVTIILTTLASVTLGFIIFLWGLGKISGGLWKKAMIKWFWKRFMLMFLIEIIPFGKMVPATTILVLMAHYREAKFVKLIDGGMSILRKRGLK